ncbi:hypothetical protein AAVH_25722 [Aphelenchoides avenae]|nr:hypothetical protein AAVH_25722 [Aphelenchus avenae]
MLLVSVNSCIQVLMICSCTSIASGMYLVIPFVPNLPPVALYVGTYTWICSHGMPAIICLTMTKTVRQEIHSSITGRVSRVRPTSTHMPA